MTKLPENTKRIGAGLPPIEMVKLDTARPPDWGKLEMVSTGLRLIDFDQFEAIVLATTGSTEAYAAAMWAEFMQDRVRYCITRDPIEQGYALVNLAEHLAWEKIKEES